MNNITIELCAEDRARLDKLTAALELRAKQTEQWAPVPESIQEPAAAPETKQDKPTKKKPTAPTEAQETPAPITDTPEEEKPTEGPTAPAEKVAPSVTFEQIQQKVVQLCTETRRRQYLRHGLFQLHERRHEQFRHETAAKITEVSFFHGDILTCEAGRKLFRGVPGS